MSKTSPRTAFIDPDFRPVAKTDQYCYVCSRDLKPGRTTCWIYVGYYVDSAIHVDDVALDGEAELVQVGPDCAARIEREHGPGFVVRKEAE